MAPVTWWGRAFCIFFAIVGEFNIPRECIRGVARATPIFKALFHKTLSPQTHMPLSQQALKPLSPRALKPSNHQALKPLSP